MKRFLTIVFSLTCLMALLCPAFAVVECKVPGAAVPDGAVLDVPVLGGAGETYATMGDLYQAWGGYAGYPDYVCGVWSTDGGMINMTVAVTDDKAGEQGKEEILSLLANPETVTFTTHKYSYRELLIVNNEIVAQMMVGGSSIVACGIYEMENKVHVSVLETAENAETIARELSAKYGDKLMVELGSELILDATAQESAGSQKGWVLVAAAALLLAGLTFARKLPARITNAGRVEEQIKKNR